MSTSTPPRLVEDPNIALLEESQIPLPPSVASSIHNGDVETPTPEVGSAGEETRQGNQAMEEVSFEVVPAKSVEKEPPSNQEVSPPFEEEPGSGPNVREEQEKQEVLIPLLELLETIRKDQYERQRYHNLRQHLNRLLQDCGKTGRSLALHHQLYRHIARCFQDDRKTVFVSLYAQSPLITRSENLDIPEPLQAGSVWETGGPANRSKSSSSWIQKLPHRSQKSIVDFLSSIRNDSSFLADRIAKLSSFQLKNLARPYRQQPVTDSLLRSSPGLGRFDPRSLHRSPARSTDNLPTVEEMIRDPVFILLHCVFDSSSLVGSREKSRHLDIWSSVCARIIEEGKPGSDDFCLSIADSFARSSPWPLESEMEMFLTGLLNSGAFVLQPEVNQVVNFAEPTESNKTAFATAVGEYFEQALQTFMDLLVGDFPSNCGPRTGLDFVRTTLLKIHSLEMRTKARNFFISRWYCASFLSSALVYPEGHAIMLKYSISSAARHKIFRELATRLQKVFSDALSPWSPSVLNLGLEVSIKKIIEYFDPTDKPSMKCDLENSMASEKHCLVLGPHDVLSVATALYPEEATDSRTNSTFDKVASGSSSTMGSSTLTAGTNEPRTRTASSFAPSFSGTSLTSNSLSTDRPGIQMDKPELGSYQSRPSTSGGLFGDASRDPTLSFLPDLWKLVTSRLDHERIAGPDTDLDMLFVSDSGNELSLAQPSTFHHIGRQDTTGAGLNMISSEPASTMNIKDQELLSSGLLRASDSHGFLDGSLFESPASNTTNLQILFCTIMRESQANYDFQSGQFWWQCNLTVASLSQEAISDFLLRSAQAYQNSIETSQTMIKHYQDWLFVVQRRRDLQIKVVQRRLRENRALRDKMWFMSEVKHSSIYEEAMNVARALKDMLEPSQPKQTGVAAWAKQRLRNSFGQDRARMQILEALAVPNDNGGPNKLTDTQVELTSKWLLNESIENFCRGEERIHRFCFEIQKCVKRLVGESLLESPVLWSSSLYENERRELGVVSNQSPYNVERPSWRTDFSYPDLLSFQPVPSTYSHSPFPTEKLHPGFLSSTETAKSSQHLGLGLRTKTQLPSQSPLFQSQNKNSTVPRNWVLPPSPISPGISKGPNTISSREKQVFVENLKITVTSLLLSDLGTLLWAKGTETDRWITQNRTTRIVPNEQYSCTGQTTNETWLSVETRGKDFPYNLHRHENDRLPAYEPSSDDKPKAASAQDSRAQPTLDGSFTFAKAFEKLLQRFRFSTDPRLKLQSLYEIVELASSHEPSSGSLPRTDQFLELEDSFFKDLKSYGISGIGIPRTRLTRLQEVTANCEERRLASLENEVPDKTPMQPLAGLFVPRRDDLTAFAIVKCVFSNPSYREVTFFRDLQYIASFVPSSILDHTPQGAAFWTVALAAMSIKSATCKSMTSRAVQILAYHYESSNKKEPMRASQSTDSKQEEISPTLSQEDLSSTTLRDAARLYSTAALEGDPAAARELALFYLTHPELVPLVTLPLSKTSEVFQTTLGGVAERNNRPAGDDSSGLDPKIFAVAFHWMEFAANAGDADAITFLQENGDLRRGK